MPNIVCRYIDATDLTEELFGDLPHAGDPIELHVGDPSPEALGNLLRDARIILNGHTFLDAAHLAAAPHLRSIIFLGSGASSYVDLDAAGARGIVVRTISGYGDRAVAEHSFALLLAAARDVTVMDREIRSGIWAPREGPELAGRTLGVIGLAGIGREMVRIADGFGMRVLGWNRSPPAETLPCEMVALEDLLARSDAVSLHLGLTPQTRNFLSGELIAKMKRGAILVNTARAGLVDTAALLEALRSGLVRHAALDVFDTEPLPRDHPLTSLPNVTLTAHAGFKTREASAKLVHEAVHLARRDIVALRNGQELS